MNNTFSIQMQNGCLDIPKADMALEWTNIRFSDGIRDQYSTDVDIPKTKNNMNLLMVSGLLDSQDQMFGEQITPCVLEYNGVMMDIYLQVVKITSDFITICLYERTLPTEARERKINDLKKDDNSSILKWNLYTMVDHPDWFKRYDYGEPYNVFYAQYHPVVKCNTIIDIIKNNCNVDIQHVSDDWYVMATKKKVCPENKIQALEGVYNSGKICIMGGQHITNDLTFSYGMTSTETIVYNRSCTVNMTLWLSWKGNSKKYFYVQKYNEDDVLLQSYSILMDGSLYSNLVTKKQYTINVNAGDYIKFAAQSNSFSLLRIASVMTVENYQITEDDYDTDMDYAARPPKLIVWNAADNEQETWWFDNTTYTLRYKLSNVLTSLTMYIPDRSFAWFGYYTNLPELTVSQFLWGLCWLMGKKIKINNGQITFVDATDNIILKDAAITDIEPNSEHFGMNNYLRFDNEENPAVLTHIENKWLSVNNDLHKSPFGYINNGKINQYSKFKFDDSDESFSCDFEECGFLVWDNSNPLMYMTGIPLKNFGLNKITQTMTCTITTTDTEIKDADYVYLDGRKFMVVEGDTDMITNESTLTTLLVPNNPKQKPPHITPVSLQDVTPINL